MHGTGSNQGFWNLLTPNDQDALVARGRDKKYPPGADLCVQGDPATHVFVLMNGRVKLLSVTDDGHQSVLALRGDGDIVGETAGGTTGQRQTTMKAISTVHALIVGYERFSSFLETYPRAGKAYRRVMTQRWNDADALLRKRSVTNGAQRLAGLLLDLAGRQASEADSSIEVALPLSQEELASLVGVSRATVTRALGSWRNRGFIRTGQRRITIVDPPGLRQAAGPAMREPDPAVSTRVHGVPKALSRRDTGQLVPATTPLPEASQPSVSSPEPVLSPEITVRLGAWKTEDREGTDFMVFSKDATQVYLCLVDDGGHEQQPRIPLSRLQSDPDVWHVYVHGAGAGQRYGYRVKGKYNPVSGHRFNLEKLLLDPYARTIEGEVNWAGPVFGYGPGPDGTLPDSADSAPYVPHSVIVDDAFDWGDDDHPGIPWPEMVIYEVHVRGFTLRHPLVPEKQRGTYTGMGSAPVIEYLKDLGITTLQLMSVFHFVAEHGVIQRGLTNYWGYNAIGYFAPAALYRSSETVGEQVREFKVMVHALHQAGIEVILDVVFSHTAEGDHRGPHLCFRGIDNRAYYCLERDQSRYKDYSRCGNSLNMRDRHVLDLIMDSLRFWVEEMHVDGFYFDLASALASNLYDAGCLNKFFDLIRKDEVISKVKLIAESWQVGEDRRYQVEKFPREWGELNDRYRDAVRSFWRGAPQLLEELAHRLTGSADRCGPGWRRPGTSINFITYHDGFTLNDLVSYNAKHNEANGEDNRDGIKSNNSWNCGVEGPTDDPEVRELRERQKRNFLTTLLLSAGVPTLLAGDERGRTQRGNNNPYCQDNEISWVDWELDKHGDRLRLLQFTKDLIKIRAEHAVFRRRRPFRGQRIGDAGMKEIGWFTPDGVKAKKGKWRKENIHTFGMFLNGQAVFDRNTWSEREQDDSFLLLFNGSSKRIRFTLPGPPWAASYVPVIDTFKAQIGVTDTTAVPAWKAREQIQLEPWSVVVLIAYPDQGLNQSVP